MTNFLTVMIATIQNPIIVKKITNLIKCYGTLLIFFNIFGLEVHS